MKRKIAIVGATMEGFMQLCDLINNKRYGDGITKYHDDEYTLIHDPDKVYPHMLSGAGLLFYEMMEREIYFTKRWLKQYCEGVEGCGYKYIGYGNRTDKNFMVDGCSHMFDIEKFRQEFIKDGGKIFGDYVTIKEERIDSFEVNDYKAIINGDEYDYVIDCCDKHPLGWENDYMNPSVDLTNAFILIEKPIAGNFTYTIQYAAKYGHITGMPLVDKQIWIYVYDSNLNSEDEIWEDFSSTFPDENIKDYKSYTYNFRPRISNYMLHPDNKRYFRNGHSAICVDPGSPGTSAQYTEFISNQICRYLFNEEAREDEVVKHEMQINYGHYILKTMQSFIAFAYQCGSRHDTEFWNKIQKESRQYLDAPCFSHPTIFPGHPVSQDLISDKFPDEDYRIAHHCQQAYNNTILPYDWMNNSNMFYQYAKGLGAPYSHLLKDELGDTSPPEEFGTIGYDCL